MNNNGATGSTALYQANNIVKSGLADCALALGFERMAPGSLGMNFPDRPPPTLLFGQATVELESTMTTGTNFGPGAPRMFANGEFSVISTVRILLKAPLGAQEYFDKYGANINHLSKIGTFLLLYLIKSLTFTKHRKIIDTL